MDIGKLILENLGQVPSFVLSLGAVAAVAKVAFAKLQEVSDALSKVQALIAAVIGASKDNTITADEALTILQDSKDVYSAFKLLLSKTSAGA